MTAAVHTRERTASTGTSTPVVGVSAETLAAVRPQVQAMLTRIPAYAGLSSEEQGRLAHDMVKVVAYMNDPNRVVEQTTAQPLAEAQNQKPDANEQTRQNLSKSPGFAGKDFVAGAAQQGTDQLVRMVQEVDFGAFVSGLINNVFKTIVETSIEQMRAYGELVAAVAKTAEDYMSENIGMGQGRDYLAQRFPDLIDVDVADDGKSTLRVVAEDEETALTEIHNTLGIAGEPVTDISDEEAEARLVNAARLQMAKSRQQLLASMVMLGINRIVVTNGLIKAKVKFNLDTTDEAHRGYRASAYDRQTSRNKSVSAFGGSFLGFGGGKVNTSEKSHVATVSTKVDETSDSKVELSASLMGEVQVNFKSDYLPLEKMATPEMIGAIQGNAQPTAPPRMAGAPAAAAPATAPQAAS
jgi:hypothetical protein